MALADLVISVSGNDHIDLKLLFELRDLGFSEATRLDVDVGNTWQPVGKHAVKSNLCVAEVKVFDPDLGEVILDQVAHLLADVVLDVCVEVKRS